MSTSIEVTDEMCRAMLVARHGNSTADADDDPEVWVDGFLRASINRARTELVAALQAAGGQAEPSDGAERVIGAMRRYPDGEVRVYNEDGKVITDTSCYEVTNVLDRLAAELAR